MCWRYQSTPEAVFCAASAVVNHLESTPGEGNDPIFLKDGKSGYVPVLYKEVLCFLKRGVQAIGLDPQEYGLHSMRRSGVQFLHGLGIPLQDLMAMGDWCSLAVLDYLVAPTDRKKDIQKVVAGSFL